jgi:pimeloyl-ACP methyl ester carboxylesterase
MKRLRHLLAILAVVAVGVITAADTEQPLPKPAVNSSFILADGLRIRIGERGTGPTIVFLHGYGESLLGWREVINHLEAGYRAVAIDVPPFGLSEKPPSGYSNQRLTAVVAEVIRQVDSAGVVLVGHSMGGQLAALVALDHPTLVRQLVLVDPAGLGGDHMVANMGTPGAFARQLAAAWQAVVGAVLPVHDPAWLTEADSALAYQPTGDRAYYAGVNALLREFNFTALEGRLSALRTPTLVIWGAHDRLFPLESVGRRFGAEIPDAKMVILPRAFHRPPATHPDAVAREIVQFLKNSP